jgi:hypothetical protein
MPDDVSETDWISTHVFYQGDQNTLLADGIAPLLGELAEDGLTTASFFLRYWEGGPHIRLRVLPAHKRESVHVRERITTQLREYLRAHPSPSRMSQRDYDLSAPRLAAQEGMRRHRKLLYPNNSVIRIPYRREHERYGHGRRMRAVERHFAESSSLALTFLASRPAADHRATMGCSVLGLAWLLSAEGVPDAPLLPGSLDSSWEAIEPDYTSNAFPLSQLVERLRLAAAHLPAPASTAPLARWGRSLLALRDELAATAGPEVGIVDLCAHLACNRIGIDTSAEMTFRYLLARAFSDHTAKVSQ